MDCRNCPMHSHNSVTRTAALLYALPYCHTYCRIARCTAIASYGLHYCSIYCLKGFFEVLLLYYSPYLLYCST